MCGAGWEVAHRSGGEGIQTTAVPPSTNLQLEEEPRFCPRTPATAPPGQGRTHTVETSEEKEERKNVSDSVTGGMQRFVLVNFAPALSGRLFAPSLELLSSLYAGPDPSGVAEVSSCELADSTSHPA